MLPELSEKASDSTSLGDRMTLSFVLSTVMNSIAIILSWCWEPMKTPCSIIMQSMHFCHSSILGFIGTILQYSMYFQTNRIIDLYYLEIFMFCEIDCFLTLLCKTEKFSDLQNCFRYCLKYTQKDSIIV